MNIKLSRILHHVIFTALGALTGYLMYVFIGCPTGTCAITSNPFSSIFYMSLVGLLLSLSVSNGCDKCNT